MTGLKDREDPDFEGVVRDNLATLERTRTTWETTGQLEEFMPPVEITNQTFGFIREIRLKADREGYMRQLCEIRATMRRVARGGLIRPDGTKVNVVIAWENEEVTHEKKTA